MPASHWRAKAASVKIQDLSRILRMANRRSDQISLTFSPNFQSNQLKPAVGLTLTVQSAALGFRCTNEFWDAGHNRLVLGLCIFLLRFLHGSHHGLETWTRETKIKKKIASQMLGYFLSVWQAGRQSGSQAGRQAGRHTHAIAYITRTWGYRRAARNAATQGMALYCEIAEAIWMAFGWWILHRQTETRI